MLPWYNFAMPSKANNNAVLLLRLLEQYRRPMAATELRHIFITTYAKPVTPKSLRETLRQLSLRGLVLAIGADRNRRWQYATPPLTHRDKVEKVFFGTLEPFTPIDVWCAIRRYWPNDHAKNPSSETCRHILDEMVREGVLEMYRGKYRTAQRAGGEAAAGAEHDIFR